MATDEFLQKAYEARESYGSTLGKVDSDVLAPLINPSFMGGPMWPDLRQAWRVIRRTKSVVIMSDGLSDPFSDEHEPNVGFGLEILGETADELPKQLQASWLFELVEQVSQQCAHHGGVADLIEDLGVLSLELPNVDELQPAAGSEGRVGVLLGVPAPDFESRFKLPGGTVMVVTAKVLWPSELDYVVEKGAKGREELVKRFAMDGTHHLSSLKRKAVV